MRILEVNKFYYPKGGAETHFLALLDMLESAGHEVVVFSQYHKKNIVNKRTAYYVRDTNLEKFSWTNIFAIGKIFWSFTAAKKMRELIAQEKPDIAHIHNIYHQISPSVLYELKKANIPIVMTVHDFKLITPNYTLWADGKKRKHKNSFIADTILKAEFYFHKAIHAYQKNIDLFIAPSEFVKTQLMAAGFDMNKIIVQPHFMVPPTKIPAQPNENNKYILSFGRLDKSKGIDVLIRTMPQLANSPTLKIAGTGPTETELKNLADSLDINDRIEFIGHQTKAELAGLIRHSLFTVFPSRVHETFGLGILESYAQGKLVIATRAGAFAEIVKDKQTGLLIDVDNQNQLATAISTLLANPELLKSMGELALAATKLYDPEKYGQKIIAIFNDVIRLNKIS